MMISQGIGFVEQAKKYSMNNAGKSLEKYCLLKSGEFAYNHGASKAKPFGVAYELREATSALVPFVYHTFRFKEGIGGYWNIALNTKHIDNQLRRLISSSARMDGLLNISYDTYTSITVANPSIEEQKRISDFFSTLDKKISLTETRLNYTKKLKEPLHRGPF